jgi:hypothetical protein
MEAILIAVMLLQPSPVVLDDVTGYDQLGAVYAQVIDDATRVEETGYLFEYMADAFEFGYAPDKQPRILASETLRDIPVRLGGNETALDWIVVVDKEFFHHRVRGRLTNEWENEALSQKFRLLVKGLRRWLGSQ